jgi:hypothetical protein
MMMNPMTLWQFLTFGFVCMALGFVLGKGAAK